MKGIEKSERTGIALTSEAVTGEEVEHVALRIELSDLIEVEPKMKSVVQLKSFDWIFFVETESSKPWLFIEATLPQRVPPDRIGSTDEVEVITPVDVSSDVEAVLQQAPYRPPKFSSCFFS